MQITGITPEQFSDAVAKTTGWYGNNLRAELGSVQSATRFRARVVAIESGAASLPAGESAPGARRSWTGRRMPAACWHAYRDVMYAIFAINPNARIATGMAVYRGLAGFESTYPATADQNIGSMMQPAYMPDLCDCDDV